MTTFITYSLSKNDFSFFFVFYEFLCNQNNHTKLGRLKFRLQFHVFQRFYLVITERGNDASLRITK